MLFTLEFVGLIAFILFVYQFFWRKKEQRKISDFPVHFSGDKNKERETHAKWHFAEVRQMTPSPSNAQHHLFEWQEDKPWYDVAIVGAGPAGATCAYFLAKHGWKCLLMEKKKFPRDKYCGDAVCKTAIEILMEMGLYEKLLRENKAHVSDSGGMCSPGGLSYVGRSEEEYGEIPAALACKRRHLDEAIAMQAKRMGADLREDCPVSNAKLDKQKGLWDISVEDSDVTYTARVLVCADGAPSKLATQLGIVTRPPDSNCSRAYVTAGTDRFTADGVIFYNRKILPGYAALFRHADGDLNYCCYLIPGNPACTMDTLAHWHDYLAREDPNISRALGPDFQMERMKAASLRLGGEKVSYGSHCLVVGDAAGMIDPMTGEGIHHAMDGGKLAAAFLDEAITHGNYDREVMAIYHSRWMERFGSDFKWSMLFCQMVYRFPILLDASTAAIQRKGDKMLLKWADIMTGRTPKIQLLRPEFALPLTYELLRLIVLKILGRPIGKHKTA